MSFAQTAASTTITRGGQAANKMSQEREPSAFDVWSHSYDGMADRMQSAATNPASLLAADPGQLANVATAATNMQSSSLSQVGNSMAAQTSALGDSVKAIGQADGALQTVGATFALLTGVEQMLSSALSFIPFPSFPALRIADFDIGLPHAHSHPPNLIPPAPPVPLPSTGPVIPIPILSGATQTLINGMPAARCGDMGLGVWCGGYFPMYEVFLGSSNVWIEGARAARLLVDITKHCTFTTPKPSDPPLGPMIGTTISASSNVLIGGIPMPSLTALAMGAAMKGVFKLAGKGAKAFGRLTAPLRRWLGSHLDAGIIKCNLLRAEPVNFATGEVVVDQQDFEIPGRIPVAWGRHYGAHSTRKGVCGYGWSTPADARLVIENDGVVLFYDGLGGAKIFPYLPSHGTAQEFVEGATLEAIGNTLRVRVKNGLAYIFTRPQLQSGKAERLVEQVEDRCGNHIRYVRDETGLREIVESAGRRIEVRSENGLIHAMWLRHAEHEPAHLLVRYEYSETAELLAVYDALEQPYRFRYEHRRLVQHTDRNSLSFYYDYDGDRQSDRCHHAWGDGGLYDYRFGFDPTARRVTITNSLGAVSTVQLNELNLPVWEIDPLGGITRYEYDDRGRTIAVTDQDGHRTGYEYDEHGNLLKLSRPDGKCVAVAYNSWNMPVTITDPGGALWKQTWDTRGLLLERITPLGHVWRYEYDNHGQLAAFMNPRGARTELTFDSTGNVACIRDAVGNRTRFAYAARGKLVARLDAIGRKTAYGYDAKGRLTHVILPSGASVRCSYDGEDNLVGYIDANGAETRLEYFGLGELARRIQPDGRSVRYRYDTEEQLVGITNQRDETYQLRRDALGRIVEETDYWGQSHRYKYSPGGRIAESIDPLGRKIIYSTDPLGQILKKRLPDALVPDKWVENAFEYDPNGNLITAESSHVRIERRFDAEGRLLEEKQGEHFAIYNLYDETGNRISRQTVLRNGRTTTGCLTRYVYDALDQAVEITINQQAPIKFKRNAIGQIIAEQLTSGLRREFEYNSDGYLTRRRVQVGEKGIVDTVYGYDSAGNLTERRDSHLGVDHFIYDPMDRIIRHVDPTGAIKEYLSDPAGDLLQMNIRRHSVTPDAVDKANGEWSREGDYAGTSFRFDRAGNLVQRADEHGDLTLIWDADQRLVESRRSGIVTRYQYDCLGRRVSKQTGNRRTLFCWDGEIFVGETTVNLGGQTQEPAKESEHSHEYLYYPGVFEPLARIETGTDSAAQVLYYHNEPNGCPTKITNGQGAVKWEADYRPWGEISKLRSHHIDNPLRLQGQYYDVETGLHYNRYRYYDPRIGQFVSQDPLGLEAGENLFRFASNPFAWIDPLGLSCWFKMQPYRYSDVRVKGPHGDVISIKNKYKITEARLIMEDKKLVWKRFGDMGKATSSDLKDADKLIKTLLSDTTVMAQAKTQVQQVIQDLTRDLTHKNKATRELAKRQVDYFTEMLSLF